MTATVAGTLLAATGRLAAVPYLDFTAVRVAGTALAVIGIGAVWVAQSGMGASWRATVDYTERSELVTTGLFAAIRNPIFTFIIATTAGLALMAPNAVALAGVVALALGIDVHVRRVEEPYPHDQTTPFSPSRHARPNGSLLNRPVTSSWSFRRWSYSLGER